MTEKKRVQREIRRTLDTQLMSIVVATERINQAMNRGRVEEQPESDVDALLEKQNYLMRHDSGFKAGYVAPNGEFYEVVVTKTDSKKRRKY